jgi:hypothetical protein
VWTIARFDLRANQQKTGKDSVRDLPGHPLVQFDILTLGG